MRALTITARRAIYGLVGAVAIGVTLLALGANGLWSRLQYGSLTNGSASNTASTPTVNSAIALMEARPQDVDTLLQLGQAYAVAGRNTDAEAALAKAYEQAPANPTVVAERAWSNYRNNATASGNTQLLYEELQRLKPEHPEALAYLAMAAFQRGDYAGAIARWETLLRALPADSPLARDVQSALTKTRSLIRSGDLAAS